MKRGLLLLACVTVATCVAGFGIVQAQEEQHHKITAQEVAEALADPAATITYFNINYRSYQDVGPFEDTNTELRLNMAGFLRFGKETTVLYRAFLPVYMTNFIPVPPPIPAKYGQFDDSGVGDALLSGYWVPGKGNFVVGPGVSMMAPTASEDYYGTGKWSLGPTVVAAYKVPGKCTVGGLVTHISSIGGDEDRSEVSITTIMPVASLFINRKGTALALGSETTYNWKAKEDNWTIPLTAGVNQILPPFGRFFLGVGVAGTYYIEKSDNAQKWDVRGTLSIVLP